jgi:hypothetical protein
MYLSLNIISRFVEVIVIVAPPLAVAYPFILDVSGYPQQIINLFVVLVRVCSYPAWLFFSSLSNRVYSGFAGKSLIFSDRSKVLLLDCPLMLIHY